LSRLARLLAATLLAAALGAPAAAHGAVSFGVRTDSANGLNAWDVLTSDLNGDGRLDAITDGEGSGMYFSRLLGEGNGTFGAPLLFGSGAPNASLAGANFTADGKLDFAAALSSSPGHARIFLGNGEGGFTQVGNASLTNDYSSDVTNADMNSDGNQDLVFSHLNAGAPPGAGVSVLLGNGSGGFPTERGPYTAGNNTIGVVVGRFDGDSQLDVVAANAGVSQLSFFSGNPDGSLDPAVARPNNANAFGIDSGDLNGDGNVDVVTAHDIITKGWVTAHLSRGDGTFTLKTTELRDADTNLRAVRVHDLDLDGVLDVVVGWNDPDPGRIVALLGRGDGTFITPGVEREMPSGADPMSVEVADLDGDGNPDALAPSTAGGAGTLSAFMSSPPITLMSSGELAFADRPIGAGPSPSQTSTLTGTGPPYLLPTSVSLTGPGAGDFRITSDGCTSARLAPGAGCTVGAAFDPQAAGDRLAQLVIQSNGGTRSVTLAGRTQPVISRARAAPRRFRARRPRRARRSAPVGTSFRFSLSERATVTIAIDRALPGRRVGRRCRPPSRRLRRARRCTRYRRAGTLRRNLAAGAQRIRFDGRFRRRPLKVGRYRATLQALSPAGARSAPARLALRVVRR
jgi:FG-GAP-like repeat